MEGLLWETHHWHTPTNAAIKDYQSFANSKHFTHNASNYSKPLRGRCNILVMMSWCLSFPHAGSYFLENTGRRKAFWIFFKHSQRALWGKISTYPLCKLLEMPCLCALQQNCYCHLSIQCEASKEQKAWKRKLVKFWTVRPIREKLLLWNRNSITSHLVDDDINK